MSWTSAGSHSITDSSIFYEIVVGGNYRYVRLENMNSTDTFMEINELEVIGGGTCVLSNDGGYGDGYDAGGYGSGYGDNYDSGGYGSGYGENYDSGGYGDNYDNGGYGSGYGDEY